MQARQGGKGWQVAKGAGQAKAPARPSTHTGIHIHGRHTKAKAKAKERKPNRPILSSSLSPREIRDTFGFEFPEGRGTDEDREKQITES